MPLQGICYCMHSLHRARLGTKYHEGQMNCSNEGVQDIDAGNHLELAWSSCAQFVAPRSCCLQTGQAHSAGLLSSAQRVKCGSMDPACSRPPCPAREALPLPVQPGPEHGQYALARTHSSTQAPA